MYLYEIKLNFYITLVSQFVLLEYISNFTSHFLLYFLLHMDVILDILFLT